LLHREGQRDQRPERGKFFNMTVGDDDYGDAFKEAKLEHDQRRQGFTEEQRLQAEADADAAALSDVVLSQLQAAAEKLAPLGGTVDIWRCGRTGKSLRPPRLRSA
jgi:hypothetical protein